MKFPIIDFIDVIIDEFKSNNIKIESPGSVLGHLNNQKFFKSSILPDISIEEYAQIIFGVFLKIKENYSDDKLETMFKNLTFFIWCETSYLDNNLEGCNECYGRASNTCDTCDGNGRQICSDCDGTGYVTDDEDNTEECYNCDGSGTVNCNDCDGEGYVPCGNCGGDGTISGDEFFDYTIHLIAALMNQNEYKTLNTYKSNNDSDIIEIINNKKYIVNLYQNSGTLEEGDLLFNNGDVKPQNTYFLGLLDDNKKNEKYSNFRIGTIEDYI
jgi:hypothetical protein